MWSLYPGVTRARSAFSIRCSRRPRVMCANGSATNIIIIIISSSSISSSGIVDEATVASVLSMASEINVEPYQLSLFDVYSRHVSLTTAVAAANRELKVLILEAKYSDCGVLEALSYGTCQQRITCTPVTTHVSVL